MYITKVTEMPKLCLLLIMKPFRFIQHISHFYLTIAFILLCFQVELHSRPANDDHVQSGMVNIRIKSGFTIDDVKTQLAQSSLPNLKFSNFRSILPNGFTVKSNTVDTYKYGISRVHDQLLRTCIVSFTESISVFSALKVMKAECSSIELAEPRFIEQALLKPNDTYINSQTFLPVIKALEAWDVFQGDTNIIIGIIDNGFLQTHEDLQDNIALNRSEIESNGIDDDNNGFPDDYRGVNLAWPNDGTPAGNTYNSTDGHGTSVAGVASGTWNNQKGIAGVGGKSRFFPIKAGRQGTDRVEFGYEGILYGIMRKFPVLNCSWGSANTYSEINQSIIDFAVEQNVLIVAGAGNDNNRAPIYPASYRGVMSVGETDVADVKSNGSSYCWSTDIMAPGFNVRTTDNENYSYTTMSGTSFAAPIISGAAALVKGKYPNAEMAVIKEHLKATADPIDVANSFLAGFLPGRLNLFRALQDSPTSRAYIQTTWSNEGQRQSKGDTLRIRLHLHNVTDIPARSLSITLRSLDNFFKPFLLLDTFRIIPFIAPKSIDTSIVLRMIIQENSNAEFYHSLSIEEESGPLPTVLFALRPTPSICTFETENLLFSIGDYASLGFVNDRTVGSAGNEQFDGIGFILKDCGSMLYDGGLVVGSSGKVITGFSTSSEFEPRTRFASDKEGAFMIVTDSLIPGSEKIGISVKQELFKLAPNSVTFKYTLTNMNDAPIFNPGFGLFGDWDIGNYGRDNKVEHFTDAIPDYIKPRCYAEIAWKEGRFANKPNPQVGILCFAPVTEPSFRPQAAGLNASGFSYTDEEFNALLNGGNSIQFGSAGDIAMFVGGRFEKVVLPNDSVIAYIVIGADTVRTELATHLKEAIEVIEGPVSVKNGDNSLFSEPHIVDNGAKIEIFLNSGENSMGVIPYSIINLQGNGMVNGHMYGKSVSISKDVIPSGLYVIKIQTVNPIIVPFINQR